MYKKGFYVLLSCSIISGAQCFGQLNLSLRIEPDQRIVKQCETLANLIKDCGEDKLQSVELPYSRHVPVSLSQKLWTTGHYNGKSILKQCSVLHVGLSVQNRKWENSAVKFLIGALYTNRKHCKTIEDCFNTLDDTKSLEILKSYLINRNINRFFPCVNVQKINLTTSTNHYCGTQIIKNCARELFNISYAKKLIAISNNGNNREIIIPTYCCEAYTTDIDNVVVVRNGSELYKYDIKNEKKISLNNKSLSDVHVQGSIVTSWDKDAICQWNLHEDIPQKKVIKLPEILKSTEHIKSYSYCPENNCYSFVYAHGANNKISILKDNILEEMMLSNNKIIRCVPTAEGNYYLIQYNNGTVELANIESRQKRVLYKTQRPIRHCIVNDNKTKAVVVYGLIKKGSVLIKAYNFANKTEQHIPSNSAKRVLAISFIDSDTIKIITAHRHYQKLLINIPDFIKDIDEHSKKSLIEII